MSEPHRNNLSRAPYFLDSSALEDDFMYILKCPLLPKGNITHATWPIFYVGLSQRSLQIWWMPVYLFLSIVIAGADRQNYVHSPKGKCLRETQTNHVYYMIDMTQRYLPSCAALWEWVGITTLILEIKLTGERFRWSSSPCDSEPSIHVPSIVLSQYAEVESSVTS